MLVKQFVVDYLQSRGSLPQNPKDLLKYEYLDAGLIDSMGIVEMINEFEKKFKIYFKPQDMQSMEFRTVGGLIQLIEHLQKKR